MKTKSIITLALMLSFFLAAHHTQAALIWSADFSSYDTSGGPVAPTLNTTGDNDTFSSSGTPSGLTNTVLEVRSTGVPSFMDGNALYQAGTADGTGTASARLYQSALNSMGSTGVFVVSFDLARVSSSFSIANEARTSSGRSGSTVYVANTPMDPLRVTLVINRTGSDITLPGTMGNLATNSLVSYRYDGLNFSGAVFSTGNVTSSSITGFATGMSLSSPSLGTVLATWYDNFGVWDSITDTVAGVNVLSLAPGMVVIPEPSTAALLLPLAALATLRMRRRKTPSVL